MAAPASAAVAGGFLGCCCSRLSCSAAYACDGFFSPAMLDPVEQTREQIVLAVDATAGQIEVHLQIAYDGAADDFALV